MPSRRRSRRPSRSPDHPITSRTTAPGRSPSSTTTTYLVAGSLVSGTLTRSRRAHPVAECVGGGLPAAGHALRDGPKLPSMLTTRSSLGVGDHIAGHLLPIPRRASVRVRRLRTPRSPRGPQECQAPVKSVWNPWKCTSQDHRWRFVDEVPRDPRRRGTVRLASGPARPETSWNGASGVPGRVAPAQAPRRWSIALIAASFGANSLRMAITATRSRSSSFASCWRRSDSVAVMVSSAAPTM